MCRKCYISSARTIWKKERHVNVMVVRELSSGEFGVFSVPKLKAIVLLLAQLIKPRRIKKRRHCEITITGNYYCLYFFKTPTYTYLENTVTMCKSYFSLHDRWWFWREDSGTLCWVYSWCNPMFPVLRLTTRNCLWFGFEGLLDSILAFHFGLKHQKLGWSFYHFQFNLWVEKVLKSAVKKSYLPQ